MVKIIIIKIKNVYVWSEFSNIVLSVTLNWTTKMLISNFKINLRKK